MLPPKSIDCTPIYPNLTNVTDASILSTTVITTTATTTRRSIVRNGTKARIAADNSTKKPMNNSSGDVLRIFVDGRIIKIQPTYNYTREYGRSALTDVRIPRHPRSRPYC